MLKILRAVVPFALLLQLISCSTLNKLAQPPRISVSGTKVLSASMTEVTLEFTLDIDNPNHTSLSPQQLNYSMELASKPVSSGSLEAGLQLPPNGLTQLKVPLKIIYREIFNSMQELFASGSAPYVIKGTLSIDPFKLPYSHAGQLELPNQPQLLVKELSASPWTLKLSIENPNKFSLALDGFEYALTLGESFIIKGRGALTEIRNQTVTDLDLQLQIPSAEAQTLNRQISTDMKQLAYSLSLKLNMPQTEGVTISQSGSVSLRNQPTVNAP